jgi:hypothetical protein
MKKRTIKEAGSYSGLSRDETTSLSNLSPELRTVVGNTVTSLRKKGKQIDLQSGARQLLQTPQFQGNSELSGFLSSFGAQSADPSKVNSALAQPKIQGNVPLPSNFGSASPKAQSPIKAQVGLPSNFQQPQNTQAPVQAKSSFQDQLAARKNKQLRMNQGQQMNVESLNELFGQAQAPNLQKIFQSIRSLRQEDLTALKGMLDGLLGNQTQRGVNMRTESKKIVTEALKLQITEQIKVRSKINSILSEGPMDGVWDKLKSAGSAIGNKMGLGGQAGQLMQQTGAKDQANQVSQELMKLVAKTNQHRQKFLSSILKNSQTLDQYHNLVTGLVQAYQENQSMVGPTGPQLVKQIQDAVGNFVYDLKSEKEQIDMFLKQIQDAGKPKAGGSAMIQKGEKPAVMDPTLLGAAAKKRINQGREQEASQIGGATSLRRVMPSVGGSGQVPQEEDLEKQKQQILLRAKNSTSEKDKKAAMNDLQALFLKQIEKEKAQEKKTAKK